MLKFTNSGLSRYKVSQSRVQAADQTAHIRILSFAVPVILGFVGLEMELLRVSYVLAALLGVVLIVGYALIARELKSLRALIANGQQSVTVVRAGMLKILRVSDLVVGDSIVVKAGAVLPVDVDFVNPVTVVAWGKENSACSANAGMRVLSDEIATVRAIACDRQIVKDVCVQGNVFSLKELLTMVLVAALAHAKAGLVTLTVALQRLENGVVRSTARQASDILARCTARQINDGWLRIRSREIAFRYNQGPVS
ncbi:hypothetical protein [Lacticaseibacillus zhaodongensis]|uniref:hypothetical protein n=1 Tax=Lacticaseibacillus zhaodongensis TaxID=2668065 RepID=UPI0012D2AF46|nr:hypothetical protein [Lacticaseibacillus zhaodongensis]